MATPSDKQLKPPAQLKPWKPGQSGNPKGRPPKERSLVTIIEHYLDMTPEQLKTENQKPNLDLAHHIAIKYVLDCHANPNHTDKLMDRLYGAPQSIVDVTSKGEQLKTNAVFNIVNPDTKILLARLESGEREPRLESNTDIPSEPIGLPIGQANNSQ